MMVEPNQTDWVEKIPLVKFAINSNVSSSSGFVLFELNYRHMPVLISGITPIKSAKPGVKQFVNQAIQTSKWHTTPSLRVESFRLIKQTENIVKRHCL